jgi:hypothetical protein
LFRSGSFCPELLPQIWCWYLRRSVAGFRGLGRIGGEPAIVVAASIMFGLAGRMSAAPRPQIRRQPISAATRGDTDARSTKADGRGADARKLPDGGFGV